MMFLIGLSMMGGYFGVISTVIPFMNLNYPNLSAIFFLLISALYAWIVMKLQTRVERFYIARHVEKNPDSTWRYAGVANR